MAAEDSPIMDLMTSKVIAMLVLGLGSFIITMLPSCVSQSTRQRHPLFISILLCFGAGVLLATALVHMLPEANHEWVENGGTNGTYVELLFCAGFFIVYAVDELVHFFYGVAEGHHHNAGVEPSRNYGSVEQTNLVSARNSLKDGERCCGDADNPMMCHVSHTEPCNKSSSGIIGLLCALFVHSFLEGLAIGLSGQADKVLLLLGAVSCHKFVVGFCLGAELCCSGTLCAHLVSAALFAGGSVAGIGAGAGLDFVSAMENSLAMPIMQALAAGTLLYVTVSEVLPRERARWHEKKRVAGVAQLIAVVLGFAAMYLCTFFISHDHKTEEKNP